MQVSPRICNHCRCQGRRSRCCPGARPGRSRRGSRLLHALDRAACPRTSAVRTAWGIVRRLRCDCNWASTYLLCLLNWYEIWESSGGALGTTIAPGGASGLHRGAHLTGGEVAYLKSQPLARITTVGHARLDLRVMSLFLIWGTDLRSAPRRPTRLAVIAPLGEADHELDLRITPKHRQSG